MITVRARGKIYQRRTRRRVRDRTFRGLFSAAGFIRSTARRSMKRSKTPSTANTPVSSPTGLAKNPTSLLFFVDKQKQTAVIGFVHSRMGRSMYHHEFGKARFGRRYPRRAVMKPALDVARPRLPAHWRASVSS